MSAAQLTIMLTVVTLVIAAFGTYLATKGRIAKENLAILPELNDELRSQIVFYQTEMSRRDREHVDQLRAQENRFNEKLHKQELECKAEISKLEGKVDTLSGELARDIAGRVVDEMRNR